MWQNLAEGEIQQQHLLRSQVVGELLEASHHPVGDRAGGRTDEECMEMCVGSSTVLARRAVHCRENLLKSFPHRKKLMDELP